MAEDSTGFDVNGGIGEGPFALLTPFLGSHFPLVNTVGTHFVKAGSTPMTVDITNGISYVPGVRHNITTLTNLTVAPVSLSGAVRWDAVVKRFDWSNNTVTIMIVQGTPAVGAPKVEPAGLNITPGDRYDQVLALVKATNGSTALEIADRRIYGGKHYVVNVPDALPTPTTSHFGLTMYVVSEAKTYRCLQVNGTPTWIPEKGGRVVAYRNDLLSPAPGWSLNASSAAGAAPLAARGIYRPDTGDVQLDIQIRRASGTINASATGNCDDTPICTFNAPFIPDTAVDPMPVSLHYASGSGSANSWLDAEATLSAAGVLTLIQLTGNVDLVPPTSGQSVRMHLQFTKLT